MSYIKFFRTGILISFLVLFNSCSSDDMNQLGQDSNESELILRSTLNVESYSNLSKKIEEQFYKTRSNDNFLTEEEAKELLTPILEDGQKIRENILNEIDKNSVDYHAYSSLTEEELIILSMIAVSNEPYIETRAISNLSGDEVLNCVGSALGIPGGIKGLSISGLVSAKTGLQVLKAVAKRYAFGYVALAISVYQFGGCINDVAKVI